MTRTFKLAFKKKKGKKLLIIEFILAYMVLFSLTIFAVKSIKDYFRPVGFDYEKYIEIGFEVLEDTHNSDSYSYEDKISIIQQMLNILRDQKNIQDYTLIKGFIPFDWKAREKGISSGTVITSAHSWVVDDKFQKVLDLKLQKGRWFCEQDNTTSVKPIILNKELASCLFQKENPLGENVFMNEEEYEVVGVIEDFYPNRSKNLKGFFIRNTLGASDFNPAVGMLIKMNTDINAFTIIELHDLLSEIVKSETSQSTFVHSLSNLRKRRWAESKLFLYSYLVVVIFLVVNLLLGLISVLRLTINRRREEIGIRRAIGASKRKIYSLIISETYANTFVGCLIGIILVFQFYIFNLFATTSINYFISIIISTIVIFLLVGIFSLYPSYQATKIEPVEALHEE